MNDVNLRRRVRLSFLRMPLAGSWLYEWGKVNLLFRLIEIKWGAEFIAPPRRRPRNLARVGVLEVARHKLRVLMVAAAVGQEGRLRAGHLYCPQNTNDSTQGFPVIMRL
jgi:hypothetical protein